MSCPVNRVGRRVGGRSSIAFKPLCAGLLDSSGEEREWRNEMRGLLNTLLKDTNDMNKRLGRLEVATGDLVERTQR